MHTPNTFKLKIPREGYEMADPYVKLYLLPDPNKETKKKTKIAKRTLNPTYNETVRLIIIGILCQYNFCFIPVQLYYTSVIS